MTMEYVDMIDAAECSPDSPQIQCPGFSAKAKRAQARWLRDRLEHRGGISLTTDEVAVAAEEFWNQPGGSVVVVGEFRL